MSEDRKKRMKVYNDVHWVKMRRAHLIENPLCELCLYRGVVTPAEDIHHKESFLGKDGEIDLNKAFSASNLVSLCKTCHNWLHKGKKTHGFDIKAAAERLDEIYGQNCPPK